MRDYEIPVLVTFRAESRSEAEELATDLADSLADVYETDSIWGADAIVTTDHNVMERLGINPEGEPI